MEALGGSLQKGMLARPEVNQCCSSAQGGDIGVLEGGYGHSFGHAIESATNFSIPHGIAVSIGMDMANHISVMRNLIPKKIRNNMHKILKKNYFEYKNIHFSLDDLIKALLKDKKNTHNSINLILPAGEKAELNKIKVLPDKIFISQCSKFIDILRK